ncbi:ABC transporter ATP-binding protein [Erysipelothrix inopinata]|uniref:ABC transporter ATP-binding protein n=1 Tax=Erysipelothrix inopinata TaxID=225084 RepID=A0A7G9RWD9_9FIRM|nr:ABC transporter ATP-binding protein [Erysipelothrix inopinata]QNN59914.1 ABC transporter ATP-binding protein [Erysipelothrix inopinata]
MSTVLDVQNIEKYYGKSGNITKALDGVSFKIEEGEFVGIMGPSGSGKTTLLNCISTIDTVTSGHIIVSNNNITNLKKDRLQKFRREQLGFIFQDFNLLDTLTAYENIALALTIQNVNYKEVNHRIHEVAKLLDIEDVLQKFPYQMSGGQQQRVASARALITNPSLILADEPTGALDSKSSRMLLEKLQELNEEQNATIMMVTHDAFSASYANRILFIKDGKIFNELVKGNDSRKEFFDKIIDVVTLLGGDASNVL